jgi:hypothetical protein
MAGWFMSDESERMSKEVVVVYFKLSSRSFPGSTEGQHEILGRLAVLWPPVDDSDLYH